MFQTVKPRGEVAVDYQDVVVGVLGSLISEKANITGLNAPNYCEYRPADFGDATNIKQLTRFFTAINQALPQYSLNIDNLITKGEKVMVKYTIRGVLVSPLMGLTPNGGRICLTGLDIFRLDRGKITEYWNANRKIETV